MMTCKTVAVALYKWGSWLAMAVLNTLARRRYNASPDGIRRALVQVMSDRAHAPV